MMKRKLFWIIAVAVTALSAYLLPMASEPQLAAYTEDEVLYHVRAEDGMRFASRFIHSVHKTPVIDRYRIDAKDTIVQESTEYQTYGIGMPFLPEDGRLVLEDGFVKLVDLDLRFRSFDLRVEPRAQYTLLVGGEEIPLYTMTEPGGLVHVAVVPRYTLWLK